MFPQVGLDHLSSSAPPPLAIGYSGMIPESLITTSMPPNAFNRLTEQVLDLGRIPNVDFHGGGLAAVGLNLRNCRIRFRCIACIVHLYGEASRASLLAMALPIPRDAPVTIAVFPINPFSFCLRPVACFPPAHGFTMAFLRK